MLWQPRCCSRSSAPRSEHTRRRLAITLGLLPVARSRIALPRSDPDPHLPVPPGGRITGSISLPQIPEVAAEPGDGIGHRIALDPTPERRLQWVSGTDPDRRAPFWRLWVGARPHEAVKRAFQDVLQVISPDLNRHRQYLLKQAVARRVLRPAGARKAGVN